MEQRNYVSLSGPGSRCWKESPSSWSLGRRHSDLILLLFSHNYFCTSSVCFFSSILMRAMYRACMFVQVTLTCRPAPPSRALVVCPKVASWMNYPVRAPSSQLLIHTHAHARRRLAASRCWCMWCELTAKTLNVSPAYSGQCTATGYPRLCCIRAP